MTRTTIALDPHFDDFVAGLVASGRFPSASAAVREGLRLLEAQEARIEELRAEIDRGEASGDPVEFDLAAFLNRKNADDAA
jgi:antitoxin ParD1/3/4